MLKRILIALLAVAATSMGFAQVTTSSITGTVVGAKNEALAGATITAVHTPSGTTYSTVSKTGGVFNLPGLRAGGPYTVTINFVGFRQQVLDGINLTLGDAYNINAEMVSEALDLSTVVVTSTRRKSAKDISGATTN